MYIRIQGNIACLWLAGRPLDRSLPPALSMAPSRYGPPLQELSVCLIWVMQGPSTRLAGRRMDAILLRQARMERRRRKNDDNLSGAYAAGQGGRLVAGWQVYCFRWG